MTPFFISGMSLHLCSNYFLQISVYFNDILYFNFDKCVRDGDRMLIVLFNIALEETLSIEGTLRERAVA